MKYLIAISLFCAFVITSKVNAQEPEKFMKAIIANDTILNGNIFEFKIILKNMNGDFLPPSFTSFEMKGGPNYSSKMQFINGSLTKEVSYTYILQPKKSGLLQIEEAIFKFDGEENLVTNPIQVFVLENPDNQKKEYKINDASEIILFSPFHQLAKDSIKSKPIRTIKKI